MLPRFCYILLSLISVAVNYSAAQSMLNEPEGITYDSQYNRYLVTTYTGNIIAVDIATGNQSLYASGLGHCYRSLIVDDTLWVALDDRISARNLETGSEYLSITFPAVDWGLREMVNDGNGYLYVLDCADGDMPVYIYKLDLNTLSYTTFAQLDSNNAISFDIDTLNNRLVLATLAPEYIYGVSLEDSSVSIIANIGEEGHDGICQDIYGNFYMSTISPDVSANRFMYKYPHDLTDSPDYIADGFIGSCSFCINPDDRLIAAIGFFDDSITYIPMHSRINIGNITFDDSEFGDGDMIPEGGETVSLSLEMQNTGMGRIDNLSINIRLDDATISVLDNSVFYGTLLPNELIINESDPLIIEIPDGYIPRIDSLKVAAIWDNEIESDNDTLSVDVAIGKCKVLIIDDDNGDSLEIYYQDALTNLRVPYLTIESFSEITDSALTEYDIVIWFTGDYRSDPLESYEVSAIEGFLDSGNKLFITGQGIAAQLDGNDQSFLNGYLKAEYLSSNWATYVSANPACQVFQPGDSLTIQGHDGALNQTTPDRLIPANGGVAELNRAGASDVMGISYSGNYQLVYFGFGFEGISNLYQASLTREETMQKILKFFNYDALCGDANGDKLTNIGDVVYLVNLVFHQGPPPIPPVAGDVNCDGNVNIGDAVYMGNFVFQPEAPEPCEACE